MPDSGEVTVDAAEAVDRALVARIADDDRAALEELYHRHAGWLTVRLERRCRERELVDSALQDTFVAVWNGAGRYGGSGAVGAWLWGIAVRRLVDQIRKRRPIPVEPSSGESVAASETSAEDEYLAAGVHGDLGEAFRHIDDDLQRVLLATAVDGLSTREAARLLGVPQGTVKTRLRRARQQLRVVMGDAAP